MNSLYSPQTNTDPNFFSNFNDFNLRSDEKAVEKVGQITLKSKDHIHIRYIQLIQIIYIWSKQQIIFRAYENNKEVGYIRFHASIGPYLVEENLSVQKCHSIYIEMIKVHEKGQGLGTKLMQSVIEYSIKSGMQGRIYLHSTESEEIPHGFYYKLGLRALDQQTNQRIAKELEENVQREIDFTVNIEMHLPEKYFKERWCKIISENPILF